MRHDMYAGFVYPQIKINFRFGHSEIRQSKPGYYQAITTWEDGTVEKSMPEHYTCLMIDDTCVYCGRKSGKI